MSIYLFKNNQQVGPYEETTIQEMLQAGTCSANDLAFREGMTEWQPLGSLLAFITSDFTVGDERLDWALRESGVPFNIVEANDSRLALINVSLENGGSQSVFCNGDTVTMFGDFELRSIWSIAYSSSEELPRSLLDFLLEQNGNVWFGAWETTFSDNRLTLSFNAKIPALLSPSALSQVIQEVGDIANEVTTLIAQTNQ